MTGLRLTVLGSGTIVPDAARGATSLLAEGGGAALLVDCGPGALESLERLGGSYRDIDGVLLSHFHPDHTLDLGRLFSAAANDPAGVSPRRLAICGPPGLARFIERWDAIYPGIVPAPEGLELRELRPGEEVLFGGLCARAGPADHGGGPALSWRIAAGGADLVYTGDTGYREELARFSRGTRLLVSECSFPDGSAVPGHLTPESVARLASGAGAAAVLLVHLYPVFGGRDPAAAVRRGFAGTVETAGDGTVIELEGAKR